MMNERGSAPRVMLICPPQKFYHARFPRGPRVGLPNGILAIGSFLQRKGCDVLLYDALIEDGFPKGTPSGALALYGSSPEKIARIAMEFGPLVIGISNIFQENMEESLELARRLRASLPEATVVVGGPNATAYADHIIDECPEVDFVAIGDGEETCHEIVEYALGTRAKAGIGSVVYADNGEIVRSKPRTLPMKLDVLGEINYALIDLEKYFDLEQQGVMARGKFVYEGSERSVSIITSRGCPYKCVFCSIHIHAGRKYRVYSADAVVDQLEVLVRKHGVKHIHFEDDNLTLDRDRFMAIMDGALARGLRFTWDTPNGVHAETLSESMMVKMKQTGCSYLIVAVESGDQWVIDNIVRKDPMTIKQVLDVFEMAKRIGIDLQAFYIVGFPGETMEQIRRTSEFALQGLRKYDVIPHFATARADVGTELYNTARKKGFLVENHHVGNPQGVHIDRFVRHAIATDAFSPDDLETLSHQYHGKFMRLIAWKSTIQAIRNPMHTLQNLRYFSGYYFKLGMTFREATYLLFFTRLFYPNSTQRR